jgi:cytochrome c-type biogenesis protein CcmH/NrfG
MFTVEESALLGRMLRTTLVLVICALLVLGYLLVRVYAAADLQPQFAQQPHHPHAGPAHRHKLA